MKYIICFEVTAGIEVEAESEEDALNYFCSAKGIAEAEHALLLNQISVTEVLCNG